MKRILQTAAIAVCLPSQLHAQYSGFLNQIEGFIAEEAEGFPQAKRSEEEKQKLREAQDLGGEALRLGKELSAPNIAGKIRGVYGPASGYVRQMQDMGVNEIRREIIQEFRRERLSPTQAEANERCLERGGNPLLCRKAFR